MRKSRTIRRFEQTGGRRDGYTTLKLERRGAIEILSLNRPEALNALSPEMARD